MRAAHDHTGCAPCHGSPGNPRSAIEKNANPPPPPLYAAFAAWEPRELFWIVKHGVKMTAMPPWPTQARNDEVWAIVAFLRRLPQLDSARYAELALGPQKFSAAADATSLPSLERPIVSVVANCLRCHGSGDRLREDAFPRLAGLSAEYLHRSLRAFREGARSSGFMQGVAAGLSDVDMRAVANYFTADKPAARPPPSSTGKSSPSPLQQGASIARLGTVSGRFPPCLACHATDAAVRNPAIPSLARQSERYLRLQLMLLEIAATPMALTPWNLWLPRPRKQPTSRRACAMHHR
jgi:cytochrome c553